jgi:hypothetical protein
MRTLQAMVSAGMLAICTCSHIEDLPVTVEDGNLALGRMRPGSWDIGEIKLCRKVELKSDPNLSTETILLCGADTTITWDILVREDQHPTAEYPPEVRSRAKLTLSIAPIQNDMLYGCPVLLRT